MKTYIVGAFTTKMLPRVTNRVKFNPISLEDARAIVTESEQAEPLLDIELDSIQSAVGHLDTARVFASLLDFEVLCNRISIQLREGTRLLLGQYSGPMLPEDARELPNGAKVEWWLVTIE